MATIKRLSLAFLFAIITASLVTTIGIAAGPFYRTDAFIYRHWTSGGWQVPQKISNTNCRGSALNGAINCRYLTQPKITPAEKPTLYAWSMPPTIYNVNHWCAYDPAIGQAYALYTIWENGEQHYSQIGVNQANLNFKGKFVYLGYSDIIPPAPNDNSKITMLSNVCSKAFWCGGLKVYIDDLKYYTYPKIISPTTKVCP